MILILRTGQPIRIDLRLLKYTSCTNFLKFIGEQSCILGYSVVAVAHQGGAPSGRGTCVDLEWSCD